MTVKSSGVSVVEDIYIQNYPVHCFSVSGTGLTMQNIVLNNTAGNAPNNRSGGLAAAHKSVEPVSEPPLADIRNRKCFTDLRDSSDGFDFSSSTNVRH